MDNSIIPEHLQPYATFDIESEWMWVQNLHKIQTEI